MKYASSIRYGGQLVEASDCDYDSYRKLGLLCPECKDPVFLRANTTQIRQGKEVLIASHFAHFSGKDPAVVLACESRVKQYGTKELEKRASQSREQRRRLFNRYFYRMICSHLQVEYDLRIPALLLKAPGNKAIIEKLILCYADKEVAENSRTNIRKSIEQLNFSDKSLKVNLLLPHTSYIAANSDLCESLVSHIVSGYDLSIHKIMCLEAFDFVITKGAKPILSSLFAFALNHFYAAIDEGCLPRKYSLNPPNNIMFDITAAIVDNYLITAPWGVLFQKASQGKLGIQQESQYADNPISLCQVN